METFPAQQSFFNIDPSQMWQDPWYRFHRIFELLESNTGKPTSKTRWLDCGCHQGQFLILLAKRYGIHGFGIDNWDAEVKSSSEFDYKKCDLQQGFSFPEKFDAISAFETLEHIIDTDKFLKCCRKNLKAGGLLLISTPNINSLRNRVTGLFGKYPTGLEYRTIVHHVRLYNCSALQSHLEEHGFETVKLIGVSFIPYRLLKYRLFRSLSELLANKLPSVCNNIIVLARAK